MTKHHSTARAAVACLLPLALAACGGGSAKNEAPKTPPTITFSAPAAASYVNGTINIQVSVTGAATISVLKFTAPAAIATAVPTLDDGTRSGALTGALNLAPFPDGPLTISVTATDSLGATATKDLIVNVAQTAPTVAVSSPTDAAAVSGALQIEATATAQTGATITSLQLLNPPPGAGVNTLPAANALAIAWDTKLAPEGVTPLQFRAVDSTGLISDKTVTVTVDNVPFGQIDTRVSAGAPISNAVIEVFAIDNTTGAVKTAVGSAGLLGSGGPTNTGGAAAVTLTAENYTGPIQVVARAPAGSTLSYFDPTNPARNIQIPATLPLTSIVASYKAGTAITVPVTLWTTLADAEIEAYVAGAHRLHATTHTVTEAAAFGDGLFAAHFQSSAPKWPLRTTVPVLLTEPPTTTLVDSAYAAFPDVALAQASQDIGVAANVGSVITPPYLLQLLREDLAGDGQFDGLGAGGAPLKTTGSPPYSLSEDTLRVQLAVGLDEFIRSTRNMSGLTRTDLQGATVFNTISEDVSEIFGPKAVTPFDNAPPVTAIAVTYGTPATAPKPGVSGGLSNLVRGVVHLSVSATDSSGVQSITVTANGVSVPGSYTPPATQGGAATFTADWDTIAKAVPDGILTFAVTATDVRSNSATSTYQVAVDNTGPVFTITAPTQAAPTPYYSGSIPMDVRATDNNVGVASCTETLHGVADVDGVSEHYTGNWTPPPATADGPVAFNFVACDLVGNCNTTTPSAIVDRTPPTVSFTTPPPAAIGAAAGNSLTVTLTAADVGGSGVGAVYVHTAASGTKVAAAVAGQPGQYAATITGLAPGPNVIAAYAVDKAMTGPLPLAAAGNSGSGRGSPYEATATVMNDSTPPTATADTTFASYYSEVAMTVAADANGRALVPAVYQYAGAPPAKVAIAPTGQINKAATRLSWGATQPTAAELEGANPKNVPVLRFDVGFDPTSQAAITTATFSATTTYNGSTSALATGNLVASTNVVANHLQYLLPLSSELIPSLATLPGPATLSVNVTFTDAAGNTATSGPFSYAFNVIGPPVAAFRDDLYGTYGDSKSAYPYTIAGQAYSQLWSSAGLFPGGQVRLVRYILTNPSPDPVAVSATFAGNWSITEASQRALGNQTCPTSGCVVDPSTGASTYSVDGYTWAGDYNATVNRTDAWYPFAEGCDMHISSAVHFLGDTANRVICKPAAEFPWGSTTMADGWYPAFAPWTGTTTVPFSLSSPAATALFRTDLGGETPPAAVGGMLTIPGAVGSVPGNLVVYVTRPYSARQVWYAGTEAVLLRWTLHTSGGPHGYMYTTLWNLQKTLQSSVESLTGTTSVSTRGVAGTALIGSEAALFADGFNATPVVTH